MNRKIHILISVSLILMVSFVFMVPSVLAAPTISTGSVTSITNTSATLSASFNVDDENRVSVHFEIGNTETSSNSYTSSRSITQSVSGLSPDTEYRYRAVLQYTTGWWFWTRTRTVYGSWRTFETQSGGSPPPERNPILFVHGMFGGTFNWNTMISRLRSAGYSSNLLYANTFSNPWSATANARNARQIQGWVNDILRRTGAQKVDLVCHSMGGLSTRYYIKNLGGTDTVDDYVSLGSPHHGLSGFGVGDMSSSSSFLRALNRGDETPGSIDYTTIASTADMTVRPTSTCRLDGATNRVVSGVSHLGLLSNTGVFNIVRAAVA